MFNVNNINSTQLIETVSIDYDDFNDTFLTCATCLCVYDGVERAPKLLPCSHTVCVHCLTRIVAAANVRRTALDSSNIGQSGGSSNFIQSQLQQDTVQQQRQTFRCPICRELIVVPQNGGVQSLPPSFLVNQLLDLISTHRRRTLIPTCCGGGVFTSHMNQELLYCENCDQVFCSVCTKHETTTSGSNLISSKSLVHTIIPVSVAIKRTSEILLYKANDCVSKLNSSRDVVRAELDKLDTARNECLVTLDETFSDLISIIEDRKQQLKHKINAACDEKNKILSQQLSAIEIEKTKVMNECGNVHQLFDIQSINQQIQILNERLQQSTSGIDEPRENAFIALDLDLTTIKNVVNNTIGQMGRVHITTTCPSHCILDVESNENLVIPCLVDSQIATLTAVDYDGIRRTLGGDPVTVKLIGPLDDTLNTQQERTANNLGSQKQENNISHGVRVIDNKNGQYTIRLCLSMCGRYQLKVYVLGRPVTFNGSTGHIEFFVTKNINPICQYNKEFSMQQPTAIVVNSRTSRVYVLDTGNCRIRVLDTHLNYICDVRNTDAMNGRSSTGLGLLSDDTLVTVNWRTNTITQITLDGETVKSWTHSSMIEPMCIAVDTIYDHVLVGDSSCNVHAFKSTTGQHLFTINNTRSNQKSDECIGAFMAIGPRSQIIVISGISKTGCRCLDIYSCKGTYERSITVVTAPEKSVQSYRSLATCNNFILALRRHYNSYVIDLIDMDTEKLINTIDSNSCKLRRPAGMETFTEVQDSTINDGELSKCLSYYLFVTDVADNSVYKYRFF